MCFFFFLVVHTCIHRLKRCQMIVLYWFLRAMLIALYILYAIRFFELGDDVHITLAISSINTVLKNFIVLILFWNFHPFRKSGGGATVTEFQRDVVFNAAFLLMGANVIDAMLQFVKKSTAVAGIYSVTGNKPD